MSIALHASIIRITYAYTGLSLAPHTFLIHAAVTATILDTLLLVHPQNTTEL